MQPLDPVFLPVVLGTPREGRRSEAVARFLLRLMSERPDATTEWIDVAELDLPERGPDRRNPPPRWHDVATRADGLLIVTPEYNHGYPGGLKNALDALYGEFFRKAVGVCGVSNGMLGGARAIQGLLPVLRGLGLVAIRRDLYVPRVREAFDAQGEPQGEDMKTRAQAFIDELVWLARALRAARAS